MLQALWGKKSTTKEKEDYPKDPRNNLLQDTEENLRKLLYSQQRAQRYSIHEVSGKPWEQMANMKR